MARLLPVRERWYVEDELVIVPLREGRVLHTGENVSDSFFNRTSSSKAVKAFRLDAIIDEGPDGYMRGFAQLMAGLRMTVVANGNVYGPWTFIAGVLTFAGIEGERIEADLPAIRHGVCGPLAKDVQYGAGRQLEVRMSYDGADVPLAFLRILAMGIGTREVE